ncbi:GNAT family N-acetyltransferase [Actinosynnema sp. NPDC059335]|uniref:GNAT family N-acetyltransferase n=1 Tax=Actinosynnema sp. NPDC059335 TaxID=3346804 RepID=UPI00366F9A39
MRSNDWHLTDDVDGFLARAGDFLRSRPALHTMPLTTVGRLRDRGTDGTVFGWLERDDEVRGLCYPRSNRRLTLSLLDAEDAEDADGLAARLAGEDIAGVTADQGTSAAFAEAWRERTGGTATPGVRVRLYRLGTLTPPDPMPSGGPAARDHEDVVRWCGAFMAAVGEAPAGSWAASRFADKHFTFWETPGGTPASLAGWTSMVAGMVRVDPVYTPAHLRGRGYAGAVTAAVARAALDGGATDVVLFADPANPTSTALYERLGYVPVTDFLGYDFAQ